MLAMKVFKDYLNENCFLTDMQEQHIHSSHPEASDKLITECLKAPLEIRRSSSHAFVHLYYILKTDTRFFCVVIKCCHDGKFISTAYTTTQIKNGQLIYKKDA